MTLFSIVDPVFTESQRFNSSGVAKITMKQLEIGQESQVGVREWTTNYLVKSAWNFEYDIFGRDFFYQLKKKIHIQSHAF